MFGRKNGSYHIIIITACLKNEGAYVDVVWNNIMNNCKYLYVTPDNDQTFINSIITIFSEKNTRSLPNIYERVVNNISHICEKDIFDVLPDCFDLCLYCKDGARNKISIDGAKGFCCYQDELVCIDNRNYAFYYPMSKNLTKKIFDKYSNAFRKENLLYPYISAKIEIKNSDIHGQGYFCKPTHTIKKDEIVMIKGGYELHRNELSAIKPIDSYLAIGDNLFLGAKTEKDEQYVKLFINHSCSPNVGMLDKRTFIAMRNIYGGEELTIDYAFVDNEDYSFDCHCGSKNCRGIITGYDWKKVNMHTKHFKYFSPYIKNKIKNKT